MSVTIQQPPSTPGSAPEPHPRAEQSYSAKLCRCRRSATRSTCYAAIALAGLHLAALNGGYGFFRDELYYAACGQRLAWGYVDHAPLAPLLARLTRMLLGDSLRALRFLPALSSFAKVFLAGWMAREMGGRNEAQFLSVLAVMLAPIYLTFDNFFSMNAFEPVFWMASAAIVLRILNGGDQRLWLLFGLVAGLGLQNKHSMLFFGSGLAVGLLLTPARREFTRIWIWLGAAIAFLIFLPNLLWEIRNGWPTIALLHAVIGKQVLERRATSSLFCSKHCFTGPARRADLAGRNLVPSARSRRQKIRLFGLVLSHRSGGDALSPWQNLLPRARLHHAVCRRRGVDRASHLPPRTGRWLALAIATPLVIASAIALPLAMPVLPVDVAVKYCRFWDVQDVHVENIPLGDLPQLFGDMHGWPEQAAAVASGLPRDLTCLGSGAGRHPGRENYGEASAIDYFGPKLGLPSGN